MTPPPAATHAAQPELPFAPRRAPRFELARAVGRTLDRRSWARLRLIVDGMMLALASAAALLASPMSSDPTYQWLAVCFPLITLAVLHARPGSDQRLYGSFVDEVAHVLGTISMAVMLMLALESLAGASHPISLALRFWVFGFVYVAGARIALLAVRRQAIRTEALSTPTLIVGAGVIGEHLLRRLSTESHYGLRPVAFIDSDPLPRDDVAAGSPRLPILGGPDDLADAITRTGARHVIIAFSAEPDHVLVDKVRMCEKLGVEVSLVPRLYEAVNERTTLDHVGGLPLLTIHEIDPRGWQFALKHTIDRLMAVVVLIVAAPLMLAIAIGVRRSSSGPALFRQRRVGRDGHEFDLIKFRTMRLPRPGGAAFEPIDGCAPGGVEGDDRRTAFGQRLRVFSLDELPQLINVVLGDMSLVGPRPERPEFVELFTRDVTRYQDRHRVKSGITGWAQVNGLRGQTSIADRVEWDNYYIRNWSLGFDLRILVLTVAEVLRLRG